MLTRFRLLGPSALATLSENVQTVVAAWQSDWFVPTPAAATVNIAVYRFDGADLERAAEYQWRVAEAGALALYLGTPSRALSRLAGSFLSDSALDYEHPLLDAVTYDALDDLLDRFLPMQKTTATDPHLSPPPEFARAGSGCSRVMLTVNDITLELWLNAAMTLQLAPQTTTDDVALVAADSCLQNQPVTLSIELDLGTVSADRLETLQVGDVIATSMPLHNTFSVVLPRTGRIASGRLGKRAEKCVVVLDH